MIKTKKKIEVSIIPDPSLIGKLGRRAKNLPETVAEIIDNSLDAFWDLPVQLRKKSCLDILIDANSEIFSIQDNGKGMTAEELGNALVVGFTKKEGKKSSIGSHGFGLKSASMNLADELTIYTMHYLDPKTVHVIKFNKTAFEARAKKIKAEEKDEYKAIRDIWKLEVQSVSPSEVAEVAHFREKRGTKVVLNHNGKYKPGSREGIQNRLRKIFGPLLEKENGTQKTKSSFQYDFEMKIQWRSKSTKTESLTASGPFYTPRLDEHNLPFKKGSFPYQKGTQSNEAAVLEFIEKDTYVDIPLKIINGKAIYGRAAILDRSQYHDGKFGFDLLKNGRVIEFNVLETKAGKNYDGKETSFLSRTADKGRIVGQLVMDDWDTDHQKTQFIREADSWNEVAEHVNQHIKVLFKRSEILQNAGRDKENRDKRKSNEPLHDFANTFTEKIRSSVGQAFRNAKVKQNLEQIIKKIDLPSNTKLDKKSIENLIPDLRFEHLGSKAPLRKYKIISEGNKKVLRISLNVDHEILKGCEVSHWNLLSQFVQIDCLAEVAIRESIGGKDLELFIKHRDMILDSFKKPANMK